MSTFKEGIQRKRIKKNVYYACSVPHKESYDVHECIGRSVVVISIKNDRNNFISRRIAPVPTSRLIHTRISLKDDESGETAILTQY